MTTHAHAKPAGTPTWVDLTTPDLEAARKFYEAIFRWEYDVGGPEVGAYITARVGKRKAAGLVGNPPGTPPRPAAWGLYFATDHIEAEVVRTVELGAKVLYPAMRVGELGGMATCEDPTGATFSFWQAGQHIGSQVTDEPGSTTWCELFTPNAKQARDFYTAILGATADPMPGGPEFYVLKHGNKMLGGIMQIDPAWGKMDPQWVNYFAVANAEATAAIATRHGGQVMGNFDHSPFGYIAAVADPSGAVFKIVERPTG